ncbi:uncharacterized protein SETTUDRAFT_166015 [Exserohilum turcica Et28A]|uniref:Uncharacterized protein n=1 Tax=Exserohilum turcicum (strain 28A) TaxID=671987 RepID=R0I7V4_EXST2|nr:uncharacterized protein SETTUDRAFT_166015 [Exserohilum turcica Et28A]EOA81615.1 hypothetical protein SETTUDRAFT_166015 [Exserohilum turcica Et28A]
MGQPHRRYLGILDAIDWVSTVVAMSEALEEGDWCAISESLALLGYAREAGQQWSSRPRCRNRTRKLQRALGWNIFRWQIRLLVGN